MRIGKELELPFVMDRDASAPLHSQLAAQLRTAVMSGVLPPGSRLPSTRLLATRLGLSRGTVLAAFEQLDGEGFLMSRHGSGTYLSEHLPLGQATRSIPAQSRPVEAPSPASGVVDLRPGQPRTTRLVDPAWTRAWRAAVAAVPATEPPLQGLPALREEISDHLAANRGMVIDPSTIFVTAGTSDGLALLAHALGLSGRRVAVEDPGYPAARRVLERLGCTLAPVPVDDDGLLVDQLANGPGSPSAVLTTPSHQYPMGGRLPMRRRLLLLEWAASTGAVVIEDDYDSEFRFDVAPLPALAGLDRRGVVAHIGTFSKVLTPWLRLGYLTAPPWLCQALLDARADLGTPVSGVDQQALADYLSLGALRRHIARARRGYAHTRAHLRRRLALHQGTLRLRGLDAGLHAVIDLPPDTDVAVVLSSVEEAGFELASLEEYRADPTREVPPAVALGYGEATLNQIDRVVAALAAAVQDRPHLRSRDTEPLGVGGH